MNENKTLHRHCKRLVTANTRPNIPQPPARLRPHHHAIATTARQFVEAQTKRDRKAGQTLIPIIAAASRSAQGVTHRVQSAFSQHRHRVWALLRQEGRGFGGIHFMRGKSQPSVYTPFVDASRSAQGSTHHIQAAGGSSGRVLNNVWRVFTCL